MENLNIRRSSLALAIALIVASSFVCANENRAFSIQGFGTIGAAQANNKEADFAATLYQPNGPGRTRSVDFTTDTKVGLQLDGKFNDQLSGVLQITSRKLASNSFEPKIEWANIKYQLTPDASIRIGRIALPTFMMADARLVGYTLTPMRVPVEVYNVVPPTNSDGVDGSYRMKFGKVTNTVQASYGRNDSKLAVDSPVGLIIAQTNARKLFNVSNTVEVGDLTLRAGYMQADLHSAQVFDYKMRTFGAMYDPGNWFVQGEYARATTSGLTRNPIGWYVMGGFRWNDFTPYIGYATVKPGDRAMTAAASYEQDTTTLGVRWDFMKNTALKLQFDRVHVPGALRTQGGASYLMNQTQNFYLNGGTVNVVSVALDFVF